MSKDTATLDRIYDLFTSGTTDPSALMEVLNSEGLRTATGRRFTLPMMRFYVTKTGKVNKNLEKGVLSRRDNGSSPVRKPSLNASTVDGSSEKGGLVSGNKVTRRKLLSGNDLIKRVLTNSITDDDRIEIATMLISANVSN